MNDEKDIILFPKINFRMIYLKWSFFALILGIFSALLAFLLVDKTIQIYILDHLYLSFLFILLLPFVAFVQSYFFVNVYIYKIKLDLTELTIEWQKYNRVFKLEFKLSDLNLAIVPSGKGNPYLRLKTISLENEEVILEQHFFGKWNRKVAEDLISKFAIIQNK